MTSLASRAATYAQLVRWLGPWTPDDRSPGDVARTGLPVPRPGRSAGETFDAWIYARRDRRPRGALLVLQGLHFLGPADPRLDRFCRVLAGAGILVCAPFVPTFTRLRVGPALGPEALAAYDAFDAWLGAQGYPATGPAGAGRIGVFSISAGSLPAAHVCAARETGPWVVFGGYHDFGVCVRFSVGAPPHVGESGTAGAWETPPDPLNRPAVHLNLLPFLPDVPADTRPLERGLLRFVEQTWGRPEMKIDGAHRRVSERLVLDLPSDARVAFRRATGLEDPHGTVALSALARSGDAFACMDPRPLFAELGQPVIIVHGRDDDVVPLSEAYALRDALGARSASTSLHVTGLYGHTGSTGVPLVAAARELRAMLGIVEGVVLAAGT